MERELLGRLEAAVENLLMRQRQLEAECRQLREEKAVWQRERQEVLAEIDAILQRLETLPREDV